MTAAADFQRISKPQPDTKGSPAEFEGRQRLAGAFAIQLNRIEPDPDQPRRYFDDTSISELADSITERGVKQPISVRWRPESECYRIIDGERRFRATQEAGLESIPCVIENSDAKEVLIDQIVANWQRSDLRPYETADALIKLRDTFELGVTDLARATGKSKGEISKLIALVDKVDDDVKLMVRDVGDSLITKRHLYALTQLEPAAQRRLAARIQRDHLTALETEQLIRSNHPIEPDNRDRRVGRPKKHVRLRTAWGDVVLSPLSASYDTNMLLKMLHEAKRNLIREDRDQ